MRVTQKMIVDRTTANLSSSIALLMRLQTQMSSGRRINRPSDDAIGVTRDLSYRTSLKMVEQYQANIAFGQNHLAAVDQTLQSAGNLLIRARELATALADDTFDATARQAAAVEARDILDQLLQIGNTQQEGRYIYSGHLTRTQTFLASSTGVVYQGDQGLVNIQIESSSQMGINLIGSNVMMTALQTLGEGFDLNPGVTMATPLADLRAAAGVDLSPGTVLVTDQNTGAAVAVDLSAAVTLGDAITAINTQLTAGGITGVTAAISPLGNSLRLTAAGTGIISAATPLANLNNGAGIDITPGTFRVATDDGSIDVTVDLSSATTVGGAIAAFNAQLAAAGVANVTMSIAPGQTALRVTDANGTPLGLKVVDLTVQSTARDLGLVGYVNDELIGTGLNPKRTITIAESAAGETTASDLGILGIVSGDKDGSDLDPILRTTTPISQLDGGQGLTLGNIRIAQGTTIRVVNLSSAVTVGDVITALNSAGLEIQASLNTAGRGIQITSTAPDKSLLINDFDATSSAGRLGIKGSPDLFGNILHLIDALNSDDPATVGAILGGLEKATNHLLDSRAAVGAKARRLDATHDRLSDLNLSVQKLLSTVEDADILKVTTELATQQNVYQAALNATARILMPSLVDFLR